jgi:hypothetical protein
LREIEERGLASLLNWKLAVALSLLGVMPLVLRKVLAWARPAMRRPAVSPEGNSAADRPL